MNPQSKLVVSPHAMSRAVGDETVILDLESGTYFGLDPVGARIWTLIGENKTIGEILDVILDEYDVERERLEADLTALAGDFIARKLVTVSDA